MKENKEITFEEKKQSNQKGQKMYTQEDFDKSLQSETDRRVTQAIESARAKWQEEFETKLQVEKEEAARLAQMTTEERTKAEADKERKLFEDERAQYQKEKLEFDTAKKLSTEGIPVEFSTILCGVDEAVTDTNIKSFQSLWSKELEKSLSEKLKGKAPNAIINNSVSDSFLEGFQLR